MESCMAVVLVPYAFGDWLRLPHSTLLVLVHSECRCWSADNFAFDLASCYVRQEHGALLL